MGAATGHVAGRAAIAPVTCAHHQLGRSVGSLAGQPGVELTGRGPARRPWLTALGRSFARHVAHAWPALASRSQSQFGRSFTTWRILTDLRGPSASVRWGLLPKLLVVPQLVTQFVGTAAGMVLGITSLEDRCGHSDRDLRTPVLAHLRAFRLSLTVVALWCSSHVARPWPTTDCHCSTWPLWWIASSDTEIVYSASDPEA